MESAPPCSSTLEEDDDAQMLHRLATSGPGKTDIEFVDRNLRFSSRFDSGNMANVQQTESGAFHVHLAEDAAAFGISTGYSTWFYFEIEKGAENNNSKKTIITQQKQEIQLVLTNMNPQRGETPANFMLDGMLQLLLHPTDESAIALRRQFVFKIIPMLNPDGVCGGFYRTDSRGVNLNRVYEDPQSDLAPTVFALKELILELVSIYDSIDSTAAQKNMVYLDLHAHSNRRGCFVYGNNHLPDASEGTNSKAMEADIARQVQTQLYARLVGLHTPFFDYMACAFDKDNMSRHDLRDNDNATTSRQGSSRVALYRATGLTYVYTIECNYNEGRRTLRSSSSPPTIPVSTSAGAPKHRSSSKGPSKHQQLDKRLLPRQAVPKSGLHLYLKFSPAEWKDVGIGALVALLDLFELPGAGDKLEKSPFRSRDGIEKNILAEIRATMSGGDGKVHQQKSRQVGKSKS
ncbi:hypothetical protein BBJ29_000283 [Phytophthora kernoviae]|uniref:Peptidase M14 domain-containing protein n=1 Tax=Phytophthora kernoviae TaxID=325452 RepID=A0A3F2S061_9STRA|nr:hypothetical protein BBJ29_000283 [Phytophthora kernoviae]RLN67700.1 hypothetical protein BBP00_00001455 [Phytophthora kernoviae]